MTRRPRTIAAALTGMAPTEPRLKNPLQRRNDAGVGARHEKRRSRRLQTAIRPRPGASPRRMPGRLAPPSPRHHQRRARRHVEDAARAAEVKWMTRARSPRATGRVRLTPMVTKPRRRRLPASQGRGRRARPRNQRRLTRLWPRRSRLRQTVTRRRSLAGAVGAHPGRKRSGQRRRRRQPRQRLTSPRRAQEHRLRAARARPTNRMPAQSRRGREPTPRPEMNPRRRSRRVDAEARLAGGDHLRRLQRPRALHPRPRVATAMPSIWWRRSSSSGPRLLEPASVATLLQVAGRRGALRVPESRREKRV